MADFLWLAAGLLVFISLSAFHPPIADVHPGIKLQECDRGTVWDGVEKGGSLPTPPAQDEQPVVKYMLANRREVCCSKKSRHVQARRRIKVWSRSTAIFIVLLLLLSGDIEINPGPRTDYQRLPTEAAPDECFPGDSGATHTDVIREVPPGVPLFHVPVIEVTDLQYGDHILYQVCQESYQTCYRSALVLTVEETRIHVVMNSIEDDGIKDDGGVKDGGVKGGVKEEWLSYSENLYIVKYSSGCYSSDEAVQRAKKRVDWNENCYHCLYNNSHHFVTWAKTGQENPLTEIIESLTHHRETFKLPPVLTKVKVSNLSDVSEGDHIVTGTQHFLVASTDTEQNTYTGYTCRRGKAVKEVCTWKQNTYNIKYEDSFSSREALANAGKEIEEGAVWSDSDTFITKMKTGRKHSFNDWCLFDEKNEFSTTQVTPEIAIDEGDHLVVKDKNGNCQSALVLKHAYGNALIVMPDLTSTEQYGTLDIKKYTEVYRINYKQSLPVDNIFQRAMSERGHEVLQACRGEPSQFVSWAKTGKKELIDVLQLKQQIAQVCPLQREKILCVEEIKVGDHLIRAYPTHWWHFMITEFHKSDPSKFKTIYCYRNHISETEEILDPSKDDIYRVIYPESLPVATAIERARSKVHKVKLSPLARMWFIRWAKTGSDDGVEIDFLVNNAMPASKSRICTFSQLNPGDYLVEEENKVIAWHHYLVTEVQSPNCCSSIASRNRRVTTSNLTFNKKSTYYRLNYNDGACISPSQAIAKAQELDGQAIITQLEYTRQKFVNYVKTGNAAAIKIDDLLDDRILLRRERVESALHLQPGDHIERPATFPLRGVYHHMMVIDAPTDERKCTVIHSRRTGPVEEEIDIIEQGDHFFRIKYPERLEPERGIKYLRNCVKNRTGYSLASNNCEHLIMRATVDEHLSIQVGESVHKALQRGMSAITCAGETLGKTLHTTAGASIKAGANAGIKAGVKAGAKAGAKASAKAGAKAIAKAGTKGSVKAGVYVGGDSAAIAGAESLFQLGFRTALSGTAIGIVAGAAVAVNIAIEGPLLATAVYKLHRKQKFGQISEVEFRRGVVKESVASASTVAGAVSGAIIGQVAIPVPVLGAAVGGALGGIGGQAFGRLEGWAASKLVSEERAVTMLPLATPILIDYPRPVD